MNRLNLAACTLLTLMTLGAGNARAANAFITWQTPGTISGGSDVSTAGTLFAAANDGIGHGSGSPLPAVTVAGVTFNPFVTDGTSSSYIDSSGNLNLSSSATTKPNGLLGGGSNQPPFSVLSPSAYQTLLSTASYNSGSMTLTINHLTPTQPYLVELWANYSPLTSLVSETITALPGDSTSLVYNQTHTDGGVGQFVIGTFTANGPSEQITFTSNGGPVFAYSLVNAIEVRAVPEPSTPKMIILGAACLLALMRFRSLAYSGVNR